MLSYLCPMHCMHDLGIQGLFLCPITNPNPETSQSQPTQQTPAMLAAKLVALMHLFFLSSLSPHIFRVDHTCPSEGHSNHCELLLALLQRESIGRITSSYVFFIVRSDMLSYPCHMHCMHALRIHELFLCPITNPDPETSQSQPTQQTPAMLLAKLVAVMLSFFSQLLGPRLMWSQSVSVRVILRVDVALGPGLH